MLKLAVLLAVLAVVLSQEIARDAPASRYAPPRGYRRPTTYNPAPRYVPPREDRINYIDEAPKPYAFSYNAPADEGVGSSSRAENGDASGRVTGSYTLTNDEGHTRYVEYVADENGFRAIVRTDEPGTANQSPADVQMESTAIHPYAAAHDRSYYRPSGIRTARARSPIVTTVEEVDQPLQSEPHVVPQPIPAYTRRAPYYTRSGHY